MDRSIKQIQHCTKMRNLSTRIPGRDTRNRDHEKKVNQYKEKIPGDKLSGQHGSIANIFNSENTNKIILTHTYSQTYHRQKITYA